MLSEIKDKQLIVPKWTAIRSELSNWCGKIALPVVTFLKAHDFSGKMLIPFWTHGGGGSGDIKSEMEKSCPGARVCPELDVYVGLNSDYMITDWLQKNKSFLIIED